MPYDEETNETNKHDPPPPDTKRRNQRRATTAEIAAFITAASTLIETLTGKDAPEMPPDMIDELARTPWPEYILPVATLTCIGIALYLRARSDDA